MKPSRRDLFRLGGGAVAGMFFTPVPWKLLDDSSIWTQNWSWTPKLPRGPISTRYTTCTLCPAGCGVRAQCVGGVPYSLSGVAGHPASQGALCKIGLGGHQLPYLSKRAGGGAPAAVEMLRERKGTLAILDGRPGRVISEAYRSFAAQAPDAVYLEAPADPAYAIDLEQVRTLVSLGAPVLENWGAPGRVWAARSRFRLIQVESRYSVTGSLADVRLEIRPGSEEAIAGALARTVPVAEAARVSGLAEESIQELVRAFHEQGPSAVVKPVEPPFGSVRDGSIAALLIDASAPVAIPWEAIERKLAPAARVVALAPFADGVAERADVVVAVPAYLETLQDVPAPAGSPVAMMSLAAPLLPAPSEAISPAAFLALLAREYRLPEPPEIEELQRRRVAAIHAAGKGKLFRYASADEVPVSEIASAEELWKALAEGGCWRSI